MSNENITDQMGNEANESATNRPLTVEEVLSNAVYHRSYRINEPITVRIIPSSMEITSFHGFDKSITDVKIKALDIRAKILSPLSEEALRLTDLSKKWDTNITQKLSNTVDMLLKSGQIEKIPSSKYGTLLRKKNNSIHSFP